MRFPKETRTLIHEASPGAATIPWPKGAAQPEPGKVYWFQSEEDARQERERREYSPATCAEVMADMHNRQNPDSPRRKVKRRRKPTGRPQKGDQRIKVLETEILQHGQGWLATVVLYEDPDPVRHTGLKTRVQGGSHPIDKEWGAVATELEPEQPSESAFDKHRRRRQEEESLKLEHAASVDMAAAIRAERKVLDQRRKGRLNKRAAEAAARAKKRAELSADQVGAGAAV